MQLKDEGVHKGWVTKLDVVGADVAATAAGIQGTITVGGGGGLAGTYLKLDCSNDPLTNSLDGNNWDFNGHAGLGADGADGVTIVLDIDETFAFVDSTRYGCFTEIDLNTTGVMSASTHLLGWDVQARWVGAHDGSTHASIQGIKGEAVTWNCAGDCNQLVAVYGKANNIGQTTVTEAIGILGFVSNDDGSFGEDGDLTNAYSMLSRAYTDKGTGVITDRYGLYIEDTTGGGLLTNQYGLYIEDMASGSASGTTYSIYSLGGNVELTDGNIATTGSITGNKVTANANLDVKYGDTGSGILAIYEDSDLGTDKATFIVPALAADTAYTLPAAIGGVGEQLTDAAGDGVLSWAAAGGAGAVAWDDIADPDNDGLTTIDFNHASENTTLTNIYDAAGIFFKIDNTDAALANEVTLLGLEFTDDAETNGIFLRCYDNNGDGVFQIGADGRMVIGPAAADYTLPTVRGAANEVLTDNGGGAVSWAAPTEIQTLAAVLALGADANDLDITSMAQLQGVDANTYIDMDTTDTITTKGNILPSANAADDLGSDALEFNNAWFDGTVNIDSLVADTADINAGTVDAITSLTVANAVDIGNHVLTAAGLTIDGTFTDGTLSVVGGEILDATTLEATTTLGIEIGDVQQLVLTDGKLNPTTDNDIDLGDATHEFKDGFFDGTMEADAITEGGVAVLNTGEYHAGTDPTADLEEEVTAGSLADDTINDDDINWADITYLTTNGAGIDEAYAAGWNTDVGPPEKDDVYDYLHNFDADDDSSFTDETWYTALLALAGGTMTGDIQLGETDIKLDAALSGDEKWSGIVIAGTSGVTTLAVGDLCYLNANDSRWELVDANLSDGYDKQLGICVLAGADGAATEMLIYGKVRSAAFPAFTVGSPLYISETAGDMTHTAPTTTDAATRLLGTAITAEDLLFNPSNDYYTHI